MGAGPRGPAARAVRRRRPGDARRRRHRAAAARRRARRGRRRRRTGTEMAVCRARRRRAAGHRRGRRVGAVRGAVPRVRGPGAAAPPAQPRPAQPLWQQRQRSAQLLEVASEYGSFPIVLETMRECLQDVFDVPGLVDLMRDVAGARCSFVEVETQQPSPFARSLLFGYVAQFLYEGDSPLAERRAAALSLDPTLLAELLGQQGYGALRELLDPDAIASRPSDLQRLTDDRRARDVEDVADLLRRARPADAPPRRSTAARRRRWLAELEEARRAIRVRVAGEERWAAVEDAGRLRDALGAPLPIGVPDAFLEPVRDPLGDLVARYARTHGPFPTAEVAARLGLGSRRRRAGAGPARRHRPGGRRRVPARRCRAPSGATPRCCARCGAARWPRCARRSSRSRSRRWRVPAGLAARRRPAARRGGRAAGRRAAAGRAVPASALESLVLPARVPDYSPAHARRAVRRRRGALGRARVAARHRRLGVAAPRRLRAPDPARRRTRPRSATPLHQAVLDALAGGGAFFFRRLSDGRLGGRDDDDQALSPRCGTWSGPGTSPTTPSPRSAPCRGRRQRAPARAGDPARPLRPRPPGDAQPHRPAGRGRPLVAAARARGRPDPAGRTRSPRRCSTGTASSPAARSLAERAPGGFAAVYRVLATVRGGRALPPRLLRRGPRRRAVRAAGSRRPAARGRRPRSSAPARARGATGRRRTRGPWSSPRPTRPTRSAPRLPWPGRGEEDAGHQPGARPARSSCWSTGARRSTSSAAAAPC